MLCLHLLLMTLSFICLMDGSSNPVTAVKYQHSLESVEAKGIQVMERKKPSKKCKKFNKKKCLKKCNICSKIKDCTKCCSKWCKVTTMLPMTTSSPAMTTTAKTTIFVSTTLTAKTTAAMTMATTTSKTTTTASPTPTTTTTTNSSPPTTATTASDSGKGECKATNGKSCIFPFKDGTNEYNECKNQGGRYFWCATSIYDSGKYKHWSYCPKDGSCPLPGGPCKTTNNIPCVFPFKDGKKEYNECADFGGKYFWCAISTNSAGQFTNWGTCPVDASCPLQEKSTTSAMTSTATTSSTTPLTNDTSAAGSAIANVENALNAINDTLQNLETAGFTEDEKQLLETMDDLTDYLKTDSLTRNTYDPFKINYLSQQLYSSLNNIEKTKQISPGLSNSYQEKHNSCSIAAKNAKLSQANAKPGRMFQLHTISKLLGIVTNVPSSSSCCAECKTKAADSELFEHSNYYKQCDCYKTKSGVNPETMSSSTIDSGVCLDKGTCGLVRAPMVCPKGSQNFLEINPNAPKMFVMNKVSTKEGCLKDCFEEKYCIAIAPSSCSDICNLVTDRSDHGKKPSVEVEEYCLLDDLECGCNDDSCSACCKVENSNRMFGKLKSLGWCVGKRSRLLLLTFPKPTDKEWSDIKAFAFHNKDKSEPINQLEFEFKQRYGLDISQVYIKQIITRRDRLEETMSPLVPALEQCGFGDYHAATIVITNVPGIAVSIDKCLDQHVFQIGDKDLLMKRLGINDREEKLPPIIRDVPENNRESIIQLIETTYNNNLHGRFFLFGNNCQRSNNVYVDAHTREV